MSDNLKNRFLESGPGRRNVRLGEEALDSASGDGAKALIRNCLTMIYPGADLAAVDVAEHGDAWVRFGRIAVGRVKRSTPGGPGEGDLVYWAGAHADYGWLDPERDVWASVATADPKILPAGIGAEAEHGLAEALEALGETPCAAIVIGQGMLGHLAGRWLQRHGVAVTVVENSPKRLEFSKYCGLTQRVDTHNLNWRRKLERYNPDGAHLIVNATGYTDALRETLAVLRPGGVVCRLGPWRPKDDPGEYLAQMKKMNQRLVGPRRAFGDAPEHRELLVAWIEAIEKGEIETGRLMTNRARPQEAPMETKRLAAGAKSIVGVAIWWEGEPPA